MVIRCYKLKLGKLGDGAPIPMVNYGNYGYKTHLSMELHYEK